MHFSQLHMVKHLRAVDFEDLMRDQLVPSDVWLQLGRAIATLASLQVCIWNPYAILCVAYETHMAGVIYCHCD